MPTDDDIVYTDDGSVTINVPIVTIGSGSPTTDEDS